MMDIKISVVVPVYNCEKFVGKCIESIQCQRFTNWELILVDDGSTDNSSDIMEKYINDERIKIIHQKNMGYSGARNTGLVEASGDYITFIDSDDWIEPDMFLDAYNAIKNENVDYVVGGVNFVYYDDISREKIHHIDIGKVEKSYTFMMEDIGTVGLRLWSECGPMYYCAWSRLYSMDIIRKHRLRFSTDLRLQEDVNFTLAYMYHSKKAYISDKVYYNYCREIDKDDTAQKPDINQYYFIEQSLINFDRIAFKHKIESKDRKQIYIYFSEWFIKLSGKIYMEGTGLSFDSQIREIEALADSYIFRYFCDCLSDDKFWSEMSKLLDKDDIKGIHEKLHEKIEEGVVPPCQ